MTFPTRRGRSIVLAVALAFVMAACTVSLGERAKDSQSHTSAPPSGSSSPTATVSPAPVSAGGRLLVTTVDGSLVTMRPDGTDQIALATPGDEIQSLSIAAWSPDGSSIVWAQVESGDAGLISRLVSSDPRGGARVEGISNLPLIYLSWDPTSSRVAFLANSPDGIRMGLFDVRGPQAGSVRMLDAGSPFYFSWAPDGRRLLVHVGSNRLEEITLHGGARVVSERPGTFTAPVWSGDGHSLVYVERRGGAQRLVAETDAHAQDLALAPGVVSFVLSPDDRHLAWQTLTPSEVDPFDRDLSERTAGLVHVLNLQTGRDRVVSKTRALSFDWSPDGRRLRLLEPEIVAEGPIAFHWSVWDGRVLSSGSSFLPSLKMLQEYTPFFAQYALSDSMWAPDGKSFAYPAASKNGVPTIYVQSVEPDSRPVPLATGLLVSWSPAAA